MSRHREIRKINYTEYGLDYDEYGRSVEDDAPISPTDARQWLFDRERGQQSVSSFLANHRDIEEEDEDQCEPSRRNSESFERPPLADDDRAKLESCIDEIRNVIGDAASDRQLVATVMRNNFDSEKSLAEILNEMSQKQEPQVKVNEKKETIEKDFCNSSNNAIYDNEVAQCPPKAFNKLAEFATFHLTNRPTEKSIETDKPKFAIPKFSIKDSSAKSTFIIPKLNGASKTDDLKNRIETPHELSMQKIMALKDLKLSSNLKTSESTASDCQTVDLSTALRTNINVPILVPHKVPTSDNFQPKFIDCEILTNYLPTITQDCEIDASHFLVRKCGKFCTKNYSKFGKIICSKFRARTVPYVDHDFRQRYAVEAFSFLSPSPCDSILKHVALNSHR